VRGEGEAQSAGIFHFFAECPRSGTRQRFFNLKIFFAECPVPGTWQRRLCRVPTNKHSAKVYFRVFEKSLSSVSRLTLGKAYFAECHPVGTRQSVFLFFYFANQTFCGMVLHYVDLHVPFWDNYKSVFYNY
jgi:hypothetical protein